MSDKISRRNPFLARRHEILAMVSTALDQMALAAEDSPGSTLDTLHIQLTAEMKYEGTSFKIASHPILEGRVFPNDDGEGTPRVRLGQQLPGIMVQPGDSNGGPSSNGLSSGCPPIMPYRA